MQFALHLFISICYFIPSIVGYNFIFGKGKILHFGHTGIGIVAAYSMWLTTLWTESFAMGFAAGIVAAVAMGLFHAWLALRLEPDGLGVMSIAIHLMMLAIVLNWQSVTRGALGIPKVPRLPYAQSIEEFALLCAVISIGWLLLLWWAHRSPLGRELDALSENEWHAASLGISRKRAYCLAFLIGSIGAVLGNFLFPQYIVLLHPNDYLFHATIFMVMCVVAGGPGNLWGVVLSIAFITLLKEGLRFLPLSAAILGPLRLMLFGAILFAAVWYRRDTLFPQRRSI